MFAEGFCGADSSDLFLLFQFFVGETVSVRFHAA